MTDPPTDGQDAGGGCDAGDDALLAIRCQLGEPEAWERLVRRWNPRLRTFLSRMLGPARPVDDVVQIVWLKAVRGIGRLDDPDRLAAWLFRIARRSAADVLRRRSRRGSVPLPEPELVPADEPPPEGDVDRERLEQGLGRLSREDREAVVLHYFEHLPIAEVAAACDVPEGTVKSRLHRARRQLHETLTRRETD